MKAKENITPKRKEVQAPAAPQGLTARLVTQTFNRIATEMESLANSTHAKTQRQAAILGLFSTINAAKAALLQLTGAPGIISQSELERVIRARDTWCYNRIHRLPAEFPAAWSPFLDKLSQLVNEGWLTEPGNYQLKKCRDRSTGHDFIAAGSKSEKREITERLKSLAESRRAARIETPSAETVQAWFDLPSEPRQAESSPSES